MKYWLMKAEPNSRVEKGKDVKFSIDDFEAVKTTPWEGVRNHEAKKLMQSMKVGDQVLFYHSNCKNPGVAGFAEISKEAYPDYTAWDPDHPYFDAKSDKEAPKWFMVDVVFKARAMHPVPLVLFKRIAQLSDDLSPEDLNYIGKEGVRAIKEMALIKRGRLSVQPVEDTAWNTVQQLAEKGGWKEDVPSVAATRDGGLKSKKGTKRRAKDVLELGGPSKRKKGKTGVSNSKAEGGDEERSEREVEETDKQGTPESSSARVRRSSRKKR